MTAAVTIDRHPRWSGWYEVWVGVAPVGYAARISVNGSPAWLACDRQTQLAIIPEPFLTRQAAVDALVARYEAANAEFDRRNAR